MATVSDPSDSGQEPLSGDLVIPALHAAELEKLLASYEQALADDDAPAHRVSERAAGLAGYLRATLREAGHPS